MTTKTAYTPLGRGLDLTTPEPQVNPDSALVAVNYESLQEGGYRSLMGYTRYDTDAVPGQGSILGIKVFADAAYAIRETVAGGTADLYRSTGAGWSQLNGATVMPVGRYSLDLGNFQAQSHTETLFMQCANSAKPFAYDGTAFSELTNAPTGGKWTRVHANHLFVGFENGSLQHSAIGDYTDWQAINGAGEIGMSDKITGLHDGPSDILVVGGTKGIYGIYGTDASSWQRKQISPKDSATPYSLVALGTSPVYVNNRGLSSLSTSQNFGDFDPVPWGAKVDPLFGGSLSIVDSMVNRERNQLRLFFDNGSGVYATHRLDGQIGITAVEFPDVLTCCDSEELSTGQELSLFGDNAGYVYRMDAGTDFNGAAIETFLTLAFNHLGSPMVRKRIRRVFLDVRTGSDIQFNITPSFDFNDPEIAAHRSTFINAVAQGGLWGRHNWDEFAWDSVLVDSPKVDLAGTGESFNMAIYTQSSIAAPHILLGYTTHYTPRRYSRA